MNLSLYYPCKPYILFQNFGENDACYDPLTKKVSTKTRGVCPLGYVGLYEYSGMKGHNGLDLYAPTGYAIHHGGPDGFVEELVDEEARGLGLGIISHDTYECECGLYQVKLRYWHLKSFNVKKGDLVQTGDLIGYADSTGFSSGSHLHFELKAVKQGTNAYMNVFQDNGYYGACNPTPYFTGIFAEDIGYTEKFSMDIKYGDISSEVIKLQRFLQSHGYFPINQRCTGVYKDITKEAVFLFQKDFIELNWYEKYILCGKRVGPKTRLALNKIT